LGKVMRLSKCGIQSERPELTGCPACGAPAEVIDRFVLQSTDGPVAHVKVRCVTGPWFTVPDRRPAGSRATQVERVHDERSRDRSAASRAD
jgi:hypothetical protein